MACSLRAGKQIQHTFTVMDLTNVGVGILGNKKVKALAKSASSVAQDYYPE